MLNKATSADETPTPGYMYGEIARSTFADINACQQLADYLLNKLQRDNPHVKKKALSIIRHVCDQGKPDFRRAIQKKADIVKSCLQYRGTPDALKGDAFNKGVREEADACIKSVFASDSTTNAYGVSADSSKKMTGFGSDSANDSSSGGGGFGGPQNSFGSSGGGGGFGGAQNSFGSSGTGGMVGFGNPNFNNAAPNEENNLTNKAMSAATSMFKGLQSKVQSGISGVTGTPSGNMGNDSSTSSYRAPTGGFQPPKIEERWKPQSSTPSATTPSSSTGEYEARIINELCAPGGPRVAPSPAALEEFCRKCESLDGNAMGGEIRKKLEENNWQTRLKALHAIEACYDKGLDTITGHVSQFSSELIFECQEMPQCKAKATKVLAVLGFIDEPVEAQKPRATYTPVEPTPAPAPAPAPSATLDLLDMGFDGPSESVIPTVEPSVASSNLLGGDGLLDMGSTPSPGLMEASAPAAGGLFGNLAVKSTDAPAPAYSPPAPEPSPQSSLFAGLQAPSSAVTPAPPPVSADNGLSGLGGMFDLQLGGSTGTTVAPSPVQQTAPLVQPQQPSLVMETPTQQMPTQQSTAPGPMDPSRTAHLNVLGGLGGPMAGGMGGAMNGNPMWQQQGAMGMPMGGGMGMQMGGQMGQPMMGGPMMGQGMMGHNPMAAMGGYAQQGGMGMMMPQMHQQQQMQMGMQMGMGGAPMGGYGGPMMGGQMSAPGMMAGNGMMGSSPPPGSAFGFIGGAGGMQAPADNAIKTPNNSAFNFVEAEISKS